MERRLGNYELIERIGKGSFGRIYLARQLTMDREVALKILSLKVAANAEFVEFFLREAQLAAQLNHPNIVSVFDVGRKSGRYFYAMEFVDGIDLHRLVTLNGPVEPRRCVDLLIAMAKALEHAHARRVIHHDVKPANMLLREDGELLLSDFGIARPLDPADTIDEEVDPNPDGADAPDPADSLPKPPPATEDRRLMGSPAYMAPEVARGHTGDARSDLYSLAASFYFVLSGRTMYTGDGRTVLAKQVRAKVPSLRQHAPDCPVRLADLVEGLLAKDPDERPQTAQAVLTDLEELQSNWSLAKRAVTRRIVRRSTARHRRSR